MKNDINAIYYLVDEFCKIYRQWQRHRLIGDLIRSFGVFGGLGEVIPCTCSYWWS